MHVCVCVCVCSLLIIDEHHSVPFLQWQQHASKMNVKRKPLRWQLIALLQSVVVLGRVFCNRIFRGKMWWACARILDWSVHKWLNGWMNLLLSKQGQGLSRPEERRRRSYVIKDECVFYPRKSSIFLDEQIKVNNTVQARLWIQLIRTRAASLVIKRCWSIARQAW